MKTFENIVNIPLLIKRLDAGTKVIRLRSHSKENQLFKSSKELSYPPANRTSLMRANFEKQPIFYGAIFSEDKNDKDIPRMTCLLETCKEVKDDSYIGKKDITYSLWVNKRPINLFVIPIFNSYENPPKEFIWYFSMWEKLISEYQLSEDIVNELRELSQKFSFATDNKDEEKDCYTYTATFTKALLEANPLVDGILYPCTKLKDDAMGINVAIRPEVIDNDFEFKGCSICRYFKRSKEEQYVLTYKHSRISQNGKIHYLMDGGFYRDIDTINKTYPAIKIKELDFNY